MNYLLLASSVSAVDMFLLRKKTHSTISAELGPEPEVQAHHVLAAWLWSAGLCAGGAQYVW